MSTSPLSPSPEQAPSAQPKDEPLSVSQALLITAGLAGLVGLFIGGLIRFSLANSSNARFLSPLQTFPALSNWAPELPQGTADSHYLPGGGLPNSDDSLPGGYSKGASTRNYDTFSEPPQRSTFDEEPGRYSENYLEDYSEDYPENYPTVEDSDWDEEAYYGDEGYGYEDPQ